MFAAEQRLPGRRNTFGPMEAPVLLGELANESCELCIGLVGAGPLMPPHARLRVAKDGAGGYFLLCGACDIAWHQGTQGWSRLPD